MACDLRLYGFERWAVQHLAFAEVRHPKSCGTKPFYQKSGIVFPDDES